MRGLDKTGTVTAGKPQVVRIAPAAAGLETPLLMIAASLRKCFRTSARLCRCSRRERKEPSRRSPISDFEQTAGQGIAAKIGKKLYFAGNVRMVEAFGLTPPPAISAAAQQSAESGETPLFIGQAPQEDAPGMLLGLLGLADPIKPDSAAAIAALKKLGIEVTLLTGDNQTTANAVAKRAGIDRVIAGVLPSGKANEIARLQAMDKRVLMVGDGRQRRTGTGPRGCRRSHRRRH